MKLRASHRCFGGQLEYRSHWSQTCSSEMNYAQFIPSSGAPSGVLIWLSGLTCTDQNFMVKAGAQKYLEELNLALIAPDTSPRNLGLPREDESEQYASGASFYLDATEAPYSKHYQMQSYINLEIYELALKVVKSPQKISLFGHSMGGHGALTIGLKSPEKYRSLSALAPASNPGTSSRGETSFPILIGADRRVWKEHDATELFKSGLTHPRPILIDQGDLDDPTDRRLGTRELERVLKSSKQQSLVRFQRGYDHSYFFVSTFIEDHIRFHHEQQRLS